LAKNPGRSIPLQNEPEILYTLSNSMPKLHDLQRGGTKVLQKAKPGNLLTEEDFFASSPSANLVGDNEEGRDFLPPSGP